MQKKVCVTGEGRLRAQGSGLRAQGSGWDEDEMSGHWSLVTVGERLRLRERERLRLRERKKGCGRSL